MEISLVPLFPRLEAAAVHGPGKHELVRNFAEHQRTHPRERFYTLTDSYGRVWIREKDVSAVVDAILPAVPVSTRFDTFGWNGTFRH